MADFPTPLLPISHTVYFGTSLATSLAAVGTGLDDVDAVDSNSGKADAESEPLVGVVGVEHKDADLDLHRKESPLLTTPLEVTLKFLTK
ncbi:hypothetical protein JTE90_015411 [Oedothorax gibbosus]|uniref:Uncharacterized protein n=1 Tax=Oedothorax gibbosus TaxID=931172 RepID=A0AAV6U6N2_9ARAC|nr:hypothetical protein JTE90_015411 [Oedothorax gibbosus]